MSILIPITISSDILSVQLSNGITLRKILDSEIKEFFGTTNRQLDKNLNLSAYNPIQANNPTEEGLFHLDNVTSYVLGNYLNVFSSNYIIDVNHPTPLLFLNRIRIALKIYDFTKTGISLYFDDKRNTHIVYPNPFCKIGNKYLMLTKKDISRFRRLLIALEKVENDKRFLTIIEKYLFSVSGSNISLENRFLDMAIILEMLLLPIKGGELSYRFSLRGSKLVNKYLKISKIDAFNLMKEIYDVRCDLAHAGKSNILNKELIITCQKVTSLLIIKYIEEKEIFSENKLDEICIL